MGYVYIYAKDADDLGTTGLCGALLPTECTHEEIAGGMSAVSLTHPFDPDGRWRNLKRGNILKCYTRVRTTPEIENGQVVTSVERWTVKETATLAQRTVYTKEVKGKKKKALAPGTRVWVTQKGESRYKFTAETILNINSKKKAKEPVGWIAHEALQFEAFEVLPPGSDGIEAVAPPWIVRPQLFRIQDVEIDTDAGTVSVYAPHISYDLMTNVTNYENDEPLTALEALNGIMDGCDFEHDFEAFTDIGDRRVSFEAININPIEALLDPDKGFLARWGAELVRDDWELYFLRRAGRNRGTRIEYAKNLLGVNYHTSDESVVTAIKPTGVKKDGDLLYLTDDKDSPANYIMSPYAGDYPTVRAITLACDNCTVEKGKKGVTLEIARARMREQAERMFTDDKVDLPDVSLTVNFVQLGDTVEYQQFKCLEPVYLYDEVPIVDKRHGIEVMTDVHRIVWDCLHERVIEMELGNIREGVASIYSWQIQSIDGHKLLPKTVTNEAVEDDALTINKMDPDLQEALNKAWADIDSAQTLLDDTRRWLDTVEGAVKDSEGNIAALEVEASYIRAGLMNAEEDLLAVMLRADLMQIALTNVEGDVSTLKLTADEVSITISDMEQSISSIRQTANSVSITVSGPGGLASQIQQLSDRVAIKLHNPGVHSTFEAIVGGPDMGPAEMGVSFRFVDSPYDPYGVVGVHRASGDVQGGMVLYGYPTVDISGRTEVLLSAGGNNPEEITLNWADRKIYATRALTVQSDARLKMDVADINQGEELFDAIIPRQYRMVADGPDGPLQYGCLAQNVKAAQDVLGIHKTELLAEHDDPEKMLGLNYEQFIALTIHKVKCMEARHRAEIDALVARLTALENNKEVPS